MLLASRLVGCNASRISFHTIGVLEASTVVKRIHARHLTSETAGKTIECLAAVAWKPKAAYWEDALSIEKIMVAPPKEGEVIQSP